MTHNPPPIFATFRCPDEETAQLYAHARDMKHALVEFSDYLHKVCDENDHTGTVRVNGKPLYDPDTVRRVLDMFNSYTDYLPTR